MLPIRIFVALLFSIIHSVYALVISIIFIDGTFASVAGFHASSYAMLDEIDAEKKERKKEK
jgi:hypothetical protein